LHFLKTVWTWFFLHSELFLQTENLYWVNFTLSWRKSKKIE
jgi:hypothetical protein